MTTRMIGDVRIDRIEESMGPGFAPEVMFKAWNAEVLAEHGHWLMPGHYMQEKNRLVLSVHTWVVRTPRHTILIDTCAGNDKHRPHFERFGGLKTPYLDRLRAAGVDPEKVDYVMCTHLHIDHVGWNTRLDNGRWVPTFPNARYVFSKTDRDFFDPARTTGALTEGDGLVFNDSVLPIIEAGLDQCVEGAAELAGGFLVEPAPGHTPGHVTIKLKSQGSQALFTGDILHHPIQIYHPEWFNSFDVDPVQASATRKRVVSACAEHGSLMLPAHFGPPHAGYVRENGGRFSFEFARAK